MRAANVLTAEFRAIDTVPVAYPAIEGGFLGTIKGIDCFVSRV
jgi:hypothetical protein